MQHPSELLAADEPSPFEVVEGQTSSPYVILCDHAMNHVPRALGSLGLAASELERHIAWDIGASGLARALASKLDAWLILQNYSRLVIDCNRPLSSADSIALRSEDTLIPGNQSLSCAEQTQRARSIFEPYHEQIRRTLDARAVARQTSLLLFVHTFTPRFRGIARPWHAGVLYHEDLRLALPVLRGLRRDPSLVVGENQPYQASSLTDYGLIEHGERRGLPCVELEVRQDLLATRNDQVIWADRLARVVVESSVASD
jgi:predicted N-formylglutamate amidohydrolase